MCTIMPIDFKAFQHDIFAYMYFQNCTESVQGRAVVKNIRYFKVFHKVFAIVALAYIGI